MPERKYTIVVGFDFSEQALAAFDYALDLAVHRPSAALHVVVALEGKQGLGKILPGHKADYESATRVQESLNELVAQKVEEAAKNAPAQIDYYSHARIGDPATEILALAMEADADTICVGTHGRTGIGRWLLGSVAEKVSRHAHCPVMIARPKEYEQTEAILPEPPCPRCVEARAESGGATWWCEEHSKTYVRPHRYSYSSNIAETRKGGSALL